jgi:mono/diheme cytochrome c family protein
VSKSLILAVVMASVGLEGCRATPPGSFESKVISGVEHHITIGGKKEKNPLSPSAENIATGKEAFGHYCAACHGNDGQDTGVPFADRMSPPVPLLTSENVQKFSDGQLKWIIDNGLKPSGMPGSSGILSNQEIWSTVLYIRHLPKAGSVGEPEMYSR